MSDDNTAEHTQVRFYHALHIDTDQRILPKLLDKAYHQNLRAAVRFPDLEMCAYFDTFLWSYSAASFLPHGRADQEEPARQPILITDGVDNLNHADVLFIAGNFEEEQYFDQYPRVCYVFSDKNTAQKARARNEWKRLKNLLGMNISNLSYHQQQADFSWMEKMRLP